MKFNDQLSEILYGYNIEVFYFHEGIMYFFVKRYVSLRHYWD